MHLIRLAVLGGLSHLGNAATLYTSHYSGLVSTLSLEGNTLTETQRLNACGGLPSWLTLDKSRRQLYCADENFNGGSVSAFDIQEDGTLGNEINATTIGGDVASTLYGGSNGDSFLAIAHYTQSSIQTFSLPLNSTSNPLQTFTYTLSAPGFNPIRQDRPHPHEVLLDPTSNFLLSPDLGADLTRIFAINRETGNLTACPDLPATPGSGPRHAVFWTPIRRKSRACENKPQEPVKDSRLYILNELINAVTAYSISYPEDGSCPSFTEVQRISTYPGNSTAPPNTTAAEIRIKDNFLYTSNRNDTTFFPNDSIATFTIAPRTGLLSFQELTSSFGEHPRTFAINEAGDRVAVGDQVSSNVAIVERDVETGRLGELVATLMVGPRGIRGRDEGLSSVVWAD